MIALVRRSLARQFEAALCTVQQCVAACPPEHWEGKIANDAFRQIAYHTLFYLDFYLTRDEGAFELHALQQRGGDERGPALSPGLNQADTLRYVALCREKIAAALAAETEATLQGPSGFSWLKFSRLEAHIYNIRHVQHHAGQMCAYLRRVVAALADPKTLRWVGSGWRDEGN